MDSVSYGYLYRKASQRYSTRYWFLIVKSFAILSLIAVVVGLLACEEKTKDYNLLASNKSDVTNFTVNVEDYQYYYWAVLYAGEKPYSPTCSCFLVIERKPIKESDMPAPFNGNLPISELYASDDAVVNQNDISKSDFKFHWNSSGDSVTVYIKKEPFCFLDGKTKQAFTKAVKLDGPYGLLWSRRK